jgi:hypothetical protein
MTLGDIRPNRPVRCRKGAWNDKYIDVDEGDC